VSYGPLRIKKGPVNLASSLKICILYLMIAVTSGCVRGGLRKPDGIRREAGRIILRPATAQSQPDRVPERDRYSTETFAYKVVGDHKILADVYRIPGDKVRPAIVWIHGGALIFGSRKSLPEEQLKLYLDAGYTVISIDYRLAPETKLPGIIEDLEDAVAWVTAEGPERFHIDPARMAVIGHSAGGYLTLMAGFRTKPVPKALVSFYGYGDITGPWYSAPDSFYNQRPKIGKDVAFQAVGEAVVSNAPASAPGHNRGQFYLYCRQNGLWPLQVTGHDPNQDPEWFLPFEPLKNVNDAYPPTVLLHGEKDTDVPFWQSVKMAEELHRHGIPVELVTDRDWTHGFDRAGMDDGAVRQAFEKILSFLEENLW
jgi:acetyl esterase/lipase